MPPNPDGFMPMNERMIPTRKLVLHVGMPKTGTKTLQSLLFSRHPGIYYLGKHTPWKLPKHCRSQEVFQMLEPLLWPTKGTHNLTPSHAILVSMLDEISQKVILGSWEGLCAIPLAQHVEMLEKVTDVFGGCKLLFTIRNPTDLVESLYLQSLRGRESPLNRSILGSRLYYDLDPWLERWRESGGFGKLLAYGERIRITIEKLGQQHTGVFLFEELRKEQDTFVRKICTFLDVDPNHGMNLMKHGHIHQRITQGQVDFLKRVDKSALRKLWFNFRTYRTQRELLDRHNKDGIPASAKLSDYWRKEIEEVTRNSNRWLAQSLNLPLPEYGYPI